MPTLNWLTLDDDLCAATRVPYRLLEEASELSAGEPDAGNMLIQGYNSDYSYPHRISMKSTECYNGFTNNP